MTFQDRQSARDAVAELLSADEDRFVRLAYDLVLGRSADADGQAHYEALLRSGRPRSAMVLELARSAEGVRRLAALPALAEAIAAVNRGQGNDSPTLAGLLRLPEVEFVHEAVRTLHGLPADDEQVLQLCGRLRAGLSRLELLHELAADRRSAAPTGVAGLDEVLAAAGEDGTGADRALNVTDAEQLTFLRGRALIGAAYRAILGRPPDAQGALDKLRLLQRGYSAAGIVVLVASSQEAARGRRALPGLDELVQRYRRENVPVLGWLHALRGTSWNDGALARWRRRRDESGRRFWEAAFGPGPQAASTDPARRGGSSTSLVALEGALLARQEAFAAIQRDNFERELSMLHRAGRRPLSRPRGTAARSALPRRP